MEILNINNMCLKFAYFITREEIRKEINQIKSQLSKKKKDKKKDLDIEDVPSIPQLPIDPLKQQYLENIKMYSSKKSEIPLKGIIYCLKVHICYNC